MVVRPGERLPVDSEIAGSNGLVECGWQCPFVRSLAGFVVSSLSIGKLAEQTGVTAKTIRYYEETGLIPPAERASNGYRVYRERAVHQLRFVKRARDLGFTMEEVSSLLALWGDEQRSSADVKEIAAHHLADIERKILELKNLRNTMRNLIDSCYGDERADCPILDDLASKQRE